MYQAYSSPLPPGELEKKIREFVDVAELEPGTRTFFEGDRPVIASFDRHQFRLQARTTAPWFWWFLMPGAWFKPFIYGWMTRRAETTELVLEGGTPLYIKFSWALLVAVVGGLGGMLIVFTYPLNLNFDPNGAAGRMILGLGLLNFLMGILVALPVIGWFLTRKEIGLITRELRTHLELQPIESRRSRSFEESSSAPIVSSTGSLPA